MMIRNLALMGVVVLLTGAAECRRGGDLVTPGTHRMQVEVTVDPASFGAALGTLYTVKSGDTLEGIAKEQLGDARLADDIAALNHINDPKKLKIDAKIQLPPKGLALKGEGGAEMDVVLLSMTVGPGKDGSGIKVVVANEIIHQQKFPLHLVVVQRAKLAEFLKREWRMVGADKAEGFVAIAAVPCPRTTVQDTDPRFRVRTAVKIKSLEAGKLSLESVSEKAFDRNGKEIASAAPADHGASALFVIASLGLAGLGLALARRRSESPLTV